MNKFDHRLHMICAPADAEAVRAALEKTLPGWLSWAPVGEVDPRTQEIPDPRCYIDSGQWTEEQAAVLIEACAGLPVKLVRGVALGLREEGAVVVEKDDPDPALLDEPRARRTVERAVKEWESEKALPLEGERSAVAPALK